MEVKINKDIREYTESIDEIKRRGIAFLFFENYKNKKVLIKSELFLF